MLANDLWDVFGNYGLSDRAWKTKNSQALRAIQWACGSEQASSIKRCKTAKEAWEHLKCRETWAPNLLDYYDGNLKLITNCLALPSSLCNMS